MGRQNAITLATLGLLGYALQPAAQPAIHEVIEEVRAAGEAHCGRVDIELAVPFIVTGRFPEAPTRDFYVFVKVGAASGTPANALWGRESGVFSRKATPWLEDVIYIGDLPGMQMLIIEMYQPSLFRLLPRHNPRAVSAFVTTLEKAHECAPFAGAETE